MFLELIDGIEPGRSRGPRVSTSGVASVGLPPESVLSGGPLHAFWGWRAHAANLELRARRRRHTTEFAAVSQIAWRLVEWAIALAGLRAFGEALVRIGLPRARVRRLIRVGAERADRLWSLLSRLHEGDARLLEHPCVTKWTVHTHIDLFEVLRRDWLNDPGYTEQEVEATHRRLKRLEVRHRRSWLDTRSQRKIARLRRDGSAESLAMARFGSVGALDDDAASPLGDHIKEVFGNAVYEALSARELLAIEALSDSTMTEWGTKHRRAFEAAGGGSISGTGFTKMGQRVQRKFGVEPTVRSPGRPRRQAR